MQATASPPLAERRATAGGPKRIAVVGTGISGMSAAWLLSQRHEVTVYEKNARIGGHSNTVEAVVDGKRIAVDTGFIVYNEPCYPNLTALLHHLNVPTRASDMSLAVSLDNGALQYGGENLDTLFAQRRNLVSPRFWSMLRDLVRFYREAPRHLGRFGKASIGEWLEAHRFGHAFRDDHLLPMAAAIWSAPAARLLDYPAEAFVRFCDNHGLLRFSGRPQWRTVDGGSINYIKALCTGFGSRIRQRGAVSRIERSVDTATLAPAKQREQNEPREPREPIPNGVIIHEANGTSEYYDAVVMATHADEALALLAEPTAEERRLLGVFAYSENRALLHSDPRFMPENKRIWSSWNYLGHRDEHHAGPLCLTYWMNRLQPHLAEAPPLFVTLNPSCEPARDKLHYQTVYHHPIFNLRTLAAQQRLWTLQGQQDTWFCGAYFGAGFHEDGLQAGLAVAEQLGGVKRPWQLSEPSSRITVTTLAGAV